MDVKVFSLVAFGIYSIIIFAISYYAKNKTKSLTQFAVGNRDMGVGLVSFTLASSFTSSAMLLVMPGYVYMDGLSGIIYILVFQQIGLLAGLLVVGGKIRRDGMNLKVISLPDYLYQKYDSNILGGLFSFLTLSLITYMVLVVVSVAYLLMNLLAISYTSAVIITVIFVFGYSIAGGSYVHSYTNVFQSMLMLIIIAYIFTKAFPSSVAQWSQFTDAILVQDPEYFNIINSKSYVFSSYLEVVYAAFIMGFCNVFQPHIFNKALYLDKGKSWNKVSFISFAIMTIFNLAVVSGIFIRMRIPGLNNPDSVMSVYITSEISKYLGAFVTVALTAAAMSTLDGVIVGMSSSIGGEINKKLKNEKKSLHVTRMIIVFIGLIIIILAYKPPSFIGIYGMWGFNILMSAAFVPTLFSLFVKNPSSKAAITASITAIIVFIVIMSSGFTINGALGCSISIPFSLLAGLVVNYFDKKKLKKKLKKEVEGIV